MVYSLTYTRPPYQSSSGSEYTDKRQSIEDSIKTASSCSMCNGIPEPLSFDRIIAGATCPPCTLRDFMNYLKYIEHSAENLQFFLWLRSYAKRFTELPESQRSLSPEWFREQLAADLQQKTQVGADTAAVLKNTAFDPTAQDPEKNPFHTPPYTPSDPKESASDMSSDEKSGYTNSQKPSTVQKKAADAYDEAGLKWQPFTVQPFRDEIAHIVAIYITNDAPRQLNLSSKERSALLHALENTTHPSAFRDVATTVEYSLRYQAHPNFIRWTICNGNRPRVLFARGLGVAGILIGIIVGLLITLSGAGRAWRVLAFIPFFIGISTLIAAWKGMCVVLHGMHHRHLRPWELFSDDESETELKGDSFDSLETTHSYETEPWIAKYDKRNFIRKIFDREVWVQEPALRQIQDTIFTQAVIGACLGSAVFTAIFVAVPKGNFF